MESYSIGFVYRGIPYTAYVHRFTDSYAVWFQNEQILKDYRGLINFDKNLKPLSARLNLPSDFKEFCQAVSMQLH